MNPLSKEGELAIGAAFVRTVFFFFLCCPAVIGILLQYEVLHLPLLLGHTLQ